MEWIPQGISESEEATTDHETWGWIWDQNLMDQLYCPTVLSCALIAGWFAELKADKNLWYKIKIYNFMIL